jgi:signal transduction histidine kinase
MRTPLNTVLMGLSLAVTQVENRFKNTLNYCSVDNSSEIERLKTLSEIQVACGVALDILNQLLLYDKIECGMIEMNKQDVSIPHLINDSLNLFAVQFREKGIDLKLFGLSRDTAVSCSNKRSNNSESLGSKEELAQVDDRKSMELIPLGKSLLYISALIASLKLINCGV